MSTTQSTFNDLPFAGFKIEAKPTGSHMWGLWFGDIILADAMNKDEATYFAAIHNLRVDAEKEASSLLDNAENLLKKTFFIVEATSAEKRMLWRDYAVNSDSPRYTPMGWQQVHSGWLVTVGNIDNRPCCISLTWNRIDGQLIMFWYQCSQVTDSLQAESWLKQNFFGTWDNGRRRASTDAENFHSCVHAIREAEANQ